MMSQITRRNFLLNVGAGLGAAGVTGSSLVSAEPETASGSTTEVEETRGAIQNLAIPIDFRYAPLSSQLTYCFPDDHHKSLVGEHGDLRYGHLGQGWGIDYFPEVVEFTLEGMEANDVRWQQLESPGTPIVHTRIDRPEAFLELTTFATRSPDEGRVDNVILEVQPRTLHSLHAVPMVVLRTKRDINLKSLTGATALFLDNKTSLPFMLANVQLGTEQDGVVWRSFRMNALETREGKPLRIFFRFPQEGQSAEKLMDGLKQPGKACWLSLVRTGQIGAPSMAAFPGVFRACKEIFWWPACATSSRHARYATGS